MNIIRMLAGKRGSQMTEAAISVPVIILSAALLIRMFVFYLEILTVGIEEHREAMRVQDSYRGAAISTYKREKEVRLVRGGLLKTDAGKRIEVRAYLINEDFLVRSGEAID